MRTHFHSKTAKATLCAVLSTCTFALSACNRTVNFFDYVSEYRSNLFSYTCDEFTVRAQEVEKEYPYVADGFCGTLSKRLEIFLLPTESAQTCQIAFFYGGKTYGGDASFDSVKREYYYSCTVESSSAHSLDMRVTLDERETEITLRSVRDERTLSGQDVLQKLEESDPDALHSLCEKNGFAGEIHLRLLYEDAPFYYVGVVDRKGNVSAFLLDAQTGKVLAKRQS